MKYEDMTPEQIEHAKKCTTPEERLAFIKENGIELSDEELDKVSGGISIDGFLCWVGIHDYQPTGQKREGLSGEESECRCKSCGDVRWFRRGEKLWYQ